MPAPHLRLRGGAEPSGYPPPPGGAYQSPASMEINWDTPHPAAAAPGPAPTMPPVSAASPPKAPTFDQVQEQPAAPAGGEDGVAWDEDTSSSYSTIVEIFCNLLLKLLIGPAFYCSFGLLLGKFYAKLRDGSDDALGLIDHLAPKD